jgi:flagellar motor protein MotB
MAAQAGVAPAQGGTDMQATFATSKAPALDPSVAQFVPQQILSHYQETAAAASVPIESATPSKRHHHRKKTKTSQRLIRHNYSLAALFRPATMTEASYSGSSALSMKSRIRTAAVARSPHGLEPSLFAPATRTAVAVVAFPDETTILDRNARNRIQSAARVFVAQGGEGYVRVVGRASGQAASLPRTTRLRNNFERSEAQATAVARELIRDGVPPEKVLIEAVGDSPTSAHASLQASRSAEIFLQS